ncbi:MAG: hypothetical protein AB8G96_00685 [Phycisphaerales bacterium]
MTADQFVDQLRRMVERSASTEGGNGVLTMQTDVCATTNEITVEILMTDAPTIIVGGQFRLEFDDALLDFVSAEPGDAPFTLEVLETDGAGIIDYAVGIPIGSAGTLNDTVMARFTFAADETCGTITPAMNFRVDDPPTRITDLMGTEYLPVTNDLPTISVDRTAPLFTSFPGSVTIECIEDAAPGIAYATVEGTVAVHYNPGGPQTPDNINFAKAQVSKTNENGAVLNFSTDPLVGASPFSWYAAYQSVDDQFGLDAVYVPPTSSGSPAPPQVIAYDNGDNSIGGRVAAGPVAWAISGYSGSSSTPNDPMAQIINSIIRGTTPADQSDFNVTRLDVDFTGPQITVDFEGSLTSDGLHHWYTVGQTHTSMANLGLNGTFFLRGSYTLDDSGPPTPGVDYFTGTTEIVANFPSSDTGFPLATDACTLFPFIGYTDAVSTSGTVTTIVRTWTATDECGNMTSADQTITVEDVTAPVFLDLPADLTGLADAGTCGKAFTLAEIGEPVISDNCLMGMPTLVPTRSDSLALTDPFPAGSTTITWTATDASGNSDTYVQSVAISPFSAFVADVVLDGTFPGGSFTRCITFEFSSGDCSQTVIEPIEVTFVNGVGTATADIACGPWTCVSARDALHTLRSVATGGVMVSGTDFQADFTGTDGLTSGDLNDDNVVDILDFGIFVGQFNVDYGTANLDCTDAGPNADFNATGAVETVIDFGFIQINFFEFGDAPCCGGAPDAGGAVAGLRDRLLGNRQLGVHRISVNELRRTGMADLGVADLNGDGWLDAQDMAAFIGGTRP